VTAITTTIAAVIAVTTIAAQIATAQKQAVANAIQYIFHVQQTQTQHISSFHSLTKLIWTPGTQEWNWA
jgi:hypothetical protein